METLFVKNMVCNRCIMVVQNELEILKLPVENVKLGEVSLKRQLTCDERKVVKSLFENLGFEVIDCKKRIIIEKIKNTIIEIVYHKNNDFKTNLSHVLSTTIQQEYSYLANIFSELEGSTIEKYFIAQKIERVKELLVYDESSITEIAFQLNYSSVAYLSNQFKKVTGFSPKDFKQLKADKRKPIDEVK